MSHYIKTSTLIRMSKSVTSEWIFSLLPTYIFILKFDCQITEGALLSATYYQIHQKQNSTWRVLLPKQAKYTLLQCTQYKLSWSSEFGFPLLSEKAMATHSSVLAWRLPGTGEPGGLPSLGSHRVGHDWSDSAAAAPLLRQQKSFT